MARDTTVQFRIDSTIKEQAFAVFQEMGISPSEAVRVFFRQVQKTRTIPFVVGADAESAGEVEDGYTVWLKTRLAATINQLDSGVMVSYPSAEAKKLLKKRLAERRGDRATQSKKSR